MKSMMLMMAQHMPKDLIIKSLGKACEEYNNNKNKNTELQVTLYSSLLLSKEVVEEMGGSDKAEAEYEQLIQIKNRMNSNN